MSQVAQLDPTMAPAAKRHFDAGNTSEWYTPPRYIEAARATMGAIDLDPASCATANLVVRAARYFDVATDGLRQPWYGRVYCNPPYSDYKGQAAAWAGQLLAEYLAGRVAQGVLLVNLSTAYQPAMQRIAKVGMVCMVSERIKFMNVDGASVDRRKRSPTQANVIFYLGERRQAFAEHFGRLGVVLTAAASAAGKVL
jgi:hypothetical protein